MMADSTIEREIVIDAPAEVVWRTITEPEQIQQWFADRVELELRPGGAGVLVFEDPAAGSSSRYLVEVDTVDPPHRFAFRWGRHADVQPTADDAALVVFTLVAEGPERTRLRVAETGVDAMRWPDAEKATYVDEHRHGWQIQLDRLVAHFAEHRA